MLQTQKLQGKVIILKGDWDMVRGLCMSMAVKLQSFSGVMLVDTANVAVLAQKMPIEKLGRIRIARPFTLEHLKGAIMNITHEEQGDKVLIVSSIDGMFASKHPKDANILMNQILCQIKLHTKRHNMITILGYEGLLDFRIMQQYADSAYIV